MLHPRPAGRLHRDHHSGRPDHRGAQMRHAPAGTWQLPRWITEAPTKLLVCWGRQQKFRCHLISICSIRKVIINIIFIRLKN